MCSGPDTGTAPRALPRFGGVVVTLASAAHPCVDVTLFTFDNHAVAGDATAQCVNWIGFRSYQDCRMLSVSYTIKSRPVDSYQYYHMFHIIHCRRYIHSHAGETVVLPCADAPAPLPRLFV